MWHQLDADAVLRELKTTRACGLTEIEAARRLTEYGRNELVETGRRSSWRILWDQLSALLVVILIVAAIVSVILGDFKDAFAIGAIVVLNVLMGFSQEYRAEKAIAALKKLAVPSVKVRRDGVVSEITAGLIVPGDIVLVEAGNRVAADCRLLDQAGLETHEAALTGESEPIKKSSIAIAQPATALGDRSNMLFMGTHVTNGRGEAVVTATGMRTELGRTASLLQDVQHEPTLLQRRLDDLGRKLATAAFAIVALIFLLGILRGEELRLLFLTAVSIGVAAVPESLPAVVTIALALGSRRMLQRKALIRRLAAVETLGSVTVICSDKTGTLTENRMTVTVLELPDGRALDLESAPDGDDSKPFQMLLVAGALCNDAKPPVDCPEAQTGILLGDPTEAALVVAASRLGLAKGELERALPRIAEIPFSSDRKRMTTVHRVRNNSLLQRCAPKDFGQFHISFTKGAAESVLDLCSAVWWNGRIEPLTAELRQRLTTSSGRLAKQGLRVLGVAFGELDGAPGDLDFERDLVFAGTVGMMDPPRPEALSAVARCKAAGIRPVMITGDHPLTAQSVAARLGIETNAPIVTGTQLEEMSPAEMESIAGSTQVYARVSPEHKLKIVQGLRRRGEIVAMTGDGVNDAPALKSADIGIAMGVSGTDVAREASDMILLDDNFATVVAAVEEGRLIYDNVRKFVRYSLTTNSAEIGVMLVAPLIGMPLPLLPLQILWMNLVTDGPPALALGVEPPEAGLMLRPPYRSTESIFAHKMGLHILWEGSLMAVLSLGFGYWYWRAGDPNWQTVLFTTLTLCQMGNAMAVRSAHESVWHIGPLSNKPLLAAIGLTTVLQLVLLYVPLLQSVFHTHALPLPDLALTLVVSSLILLAVEMEKWIARRRNTIPAVDLSHPCT